MTAYEMTHRYLLYVWPKPVSAGEVAAQLHRRRREARRLLRLVEKNGCAKRSGFRWVAQGAASTS